MIPTQFLLWFFMSKTKRVKEEGQVIEDTHGPLVQALLLRVILAPPSIYKVVEMDFLGRRGGSVS